MRRRFLAPPLAVLCLSALTASAQQAVPPAPPDRAKVIAAARTVMEKARYCTLITLGEDGQPQARIVDPFAPEGDMSVWIGTSPLTRKVPQITKDPRVTLMYFDTATMSYVTLQAKAQLVTDAAEKGRHWKESWAKLYKDGNRGDDYVLIRVAPFHLEVLSPANGMIPDEKTWRPVAIDLR